MVQKLKKVITIKKELSDKQKAHIEKLGKPKKGKKYVEQIPETEIELPIEVIPKKTRAPRVKPVEPESECESEPEVRIVRKKKQIIIEQTESEEEEPLPVAQLKTKAKAVKTKAKPVVK